MVPTILKKGVAGSVSTKHYVDGIAVTSGLTSVTAIIYTPTGGTLKASQAVTPVSGVMTASLTASDTGTLYDNCRALFQYTYDSQVYTKNIYFHIANTAFDIQFYFDDLKNYYPNLDGMESTTDNDFGRLRELARNELYDELVNRGIQPWKILNLDELQTTFAHLWLGLIWAQMAQSSPDYLQQVEYHEKKYLQSLKVANITIDYGEDANRGNESSEPLNQKMAVRG